jgi:hypothetical protein
MTVYEEVKSTVEPDAIKIDEYSVWVAGDIREDGGEWEYTLTQYEKDEYIKLMDEKSAALDAQLTDTQLALCDVYEMMGG